MGVAGNLIVRVGANITNFEKQLNKIEKSLNKVGRQVTRAGEQLTTGLTLPIVGAGAALLTLGQKFDEATATIRAGTGATGDELEKLKEDFKEVYKTVPTDTQEASKAIADLSTRLGLSGKPLQDLSIQMLNVSRVMKEDVGSVVESTTRAFGDWGITAEQQGEKADYLFKVSQATGIEFGKLGNMIVQYGAPLRQLGFDFEQSAALMGKFEKEGVNTELVMGSLRIALGKMSREGVTDTSAALQQVVKDIQDAGSAGEANAIALETFGARAGADMAAAIREGRFEIDELLSTLNGSPETINKAADDTLTLTDKFKLLKNDVSTALEPLGELLVEIAEKLIPHIQKFSDKISKLAEWFTNLSPKTQKIILLMIATTAAIGPLLLIVGKVITVVSSVISVIKLLGTALSFLAANPVVLVIAIIAALVVGIVALWKTNEGFRDFITKAWNGIKDTFVSVGSAISNVWEGIKSTIKNSINWVIGKINTFINRINAIKINIPSVNIPGIGTVGGGSIGMPKIPNIPQLATGTNYVPDDMLAMVHKGEAVVPAKYNNGSNGITINITGNKIMNERDASILGDKIVKRLRMAGV